MGFSNDIIPVPMAMFPTQAKRPLQTAMSNGKISKELNVFIPTWQESLEKYTDIIKKIMIITLKIHFGSFVTAKYTSNSMCNYLITTFGDPTKIRLIYYFPGL